MICLFEPGISNVPSSWKEWVNRAIQHVHLNTPHKAQGLFYFTTPLTVFIREKERTQAFADMMAGYAKAGMRIVCAGHSNGTRVILNGLAAAGWPAVEELHLLCGACDADFERNGLNAALANGKVGRVFVYIAGKDWAMKAEDTLLGHWLFGVRTKDKPLGLAGPMNLAAGLASRRTEIVTWPGFGHSTCWEPDQFESTMDQIVPISR